MSEKAIRLEKPADWPTWLSFVRIRAEGDHIWGLINPDLPARPACLEKPVKPAFNRGTGPIDLVAFEQHKALLVLYKSDLADYDVQNGAFNRIILHIQSTISATAAIFIQDVDAHPLNLLRTLKQRLSPTDEFRKIYIESKYHELCKGPGNQEIEKWLDTWQQVYTEGKKIGVAETSENRPIRDFIYSLMDRDEAWANAHLVATQAQVLDDSLFTLISEYRDHARLKASRKIHATGSHSAFPASQESQRPSFNNQNQPGRQASFRNQIQPQECLCGLVHWFSECNYLNPTKRPFNWKSDPETARRVNEAMKDENTKAWVEKALRKNQEYEKDRNNHSGNLGNAGSEKSGSGGASAFPAGGAYEENPEYSHGAFTATASPISSNYPLQKSWILDNGANIHICNKSMLHRFRKTRDAENEEVLAGENRSKIEAYGEVEISIDAPGGKSGK